MSSSIRKNSFFNIVKTLSSLLFPLITFPYISRILEAENLGRTVFASNVVSYFSLFAMFGINSYGVREVAKFRNNKDELSKLIAELFIINISTTVITYILFFLSIFFVSSFFKYKTLLLIYSLTIIFTVIGFEWIYTGLEKFFYLTIRYIVFQALSILLLLVFVKTSEDFIKYAVISVFPSVGANLVNFFQLKKFLFTDIFFVQRNLDLRKHLKPLLVLFLLVFVGSVYSLLDSVMLGILSGDYQVGIYSVATKINKLVLTLVVSVGAVLLPRLSFLLGNENRKDFLALFYKSLDFTFLMAFPCCIGLFVLAEPITVLLSGKKFLESVPCMKMMNPIILIIGISNCIGVQLLFPLGKEKLVLVSGFFGATINILLNLLLIKKYGGFGAAIATICAEFTVASIQLFFSRRIIDLKKFSARFFYYLAISLAMGIFVFLIARLIPNSILKIFISVLAGMIAYLFLLFITKNQFLYSLLQKKRSSLC